MTEEAVHARYDQEIAGKPGEEEVHAQHILVDRGRSEEHHRCNSRGATSPHSRSSTARTPARSRAGISVSSRRETWCLHSPDRGLRPSARPVLADAGAQQFGWHVILVVERKRDEPPSSSKRATSCARR